MRCFFARLGAATALALLVTAQRKTLEALRRHRRASLRLIPV